MQAKVKDSWSQAKVRAFTGREYVKYEWRRVPDGNEGEAEKLDKRGLLEFRNAVPDGSAPSLPPSEEGGSDDESPSVDATDAAVELAAELGIDIADVEGTGEDGRVLVGDVRALVEEEE